jgi:hypothetical protein
MSSESKPAYRFETLQLHAGQTPAPGNASTARERDRSARATVSFTEFQVIVVTNT